MSVHRSRMLPRFCVYVITHTATERRYVGKTDDPLRRLRQHLSVSRGVARASRIHHAIRKYGSRAFTFRVVEWFSDEDASLAGETKWIRFFKSNEPSLGFNLNEGGRGGKSPSAESRAKVAAAKRGIPRSEATKAKLRAAKLGMKMPETHREKARTRMLGSKASEETREKMRAAWERRKSRGPTEKERAAVSVFSQVNVGRKPSAETRQKMREAQLARPPRSAEWRANISKACTGRRLSEEAKAARRARMAAKKPNGNE